MRQGDEVLPRERYFAMELSRGLQILAARVGVCHNHRPAMHAPSEGATSRSSSDQGIFAVFVSFGSFAFPRQIPCPAGSLHVANVVGIDSQHTD